MNLPHTPVPVLLAAALPDHPGLLASIVFQINGLIVVFIALGLIWGMLEIMGFVFRRINRSPAPRPVPPAAPAAARTDEITPELVAAIAAAVQLVLGGAPHRIEAIIPHDPALDWAQEGRRQIFASHRHR